MWKPNINGHVRVVVCLTLYCLQLLSVAKCVFPGVSCVFALFE